jgi:hypothetical protein
MLTSLLAYVKGLVRRNTIDAEVNEELRFHVEMETRANIDRGMTPQEARRVALRDLGGVTQTREAVRDVRGAWVDAIAQGVRLGLRSLKRNPVFYAAVGTTLGIGLAVAVTLFNVEDAIFFRPLEVPTAARLYRIEVHAASSSANRARVDRRAVDELNAAALPKFARFAGVEQFQRDVRLNGLTTSVFCAEVTPSFFEVLDVPLSFTPGSGTARRTTTQTGPDTGIDDVILGYDFWQRHLGGRRGVAAPTSPSPRRRAGGWTEASSSGYSGRLPLLRACRGRSSIRTS